MRSSPRWAGGLCADLLGFGVLAFVSLLAGLGINQMRYQPLPLIYHTNDERLRAAVTRLAASEHAVIPPAPGSPPPREIRIEEFQAMVVRRVTLIDARAPFFYRQGHVPGAINLARENFEADYARLGGRLIAHKADAVAVYCSGVDCEDAQLVANALGALGFQRLFVYKEGWDEWSQSGLPQEK